MPWLCNSWTAEGTGGQDIAKPWKTKHRNCSGQNVVCDWSKVLHRVQWMMESVAIRANKKSSKQVISEVGFFFSSFFFAFFSVQLGVKTENPCRDKTENSSWVQHVLWTWHPDLPRTKPLPQVLRLVIFSGRGGHYMFQSMKMSSGTNLFSSALL